MCAFSILPFFFLKTAPKCLSFSLQGNAKKAKRFYMRRKQKEGKQENGRKERTKEQTTESKTDKLHNYPNEAPGAVYVCVMIQASFLQFATAGQAKALHFASAQPSQIARQISHSISRSWRGSR